MEAVLRVGRWIADARHCNAQEERRRTLFAVVLLHFFLCGVSWLVTEAFFGQDAEAYVGAGVGDLEESEHVHLLPSHHYHTLLAENYHLSNLLRIHHLRHFSMLVINSIVAAILLAMLARQAPLGRVMALWVAYIYAHAFYFGVYRPHLGTEKWFLVVPLQVFFGLGATPGALSLCFSFVLQVLLFYARQAAPAPTLVLDAPANFVVNLAFLTYVGLSCAGYEYVCAFALDRMETALDQARRANKSLKHAIKVKERFLANVSHELRTPMHGILSTVEDMVHTTKVRRSHKLREAVTLISDCSDHLCTVINDILDFQTLDTDQIRLERLTFDITEQIEQVCQMVMASSRNTKQLHFEKHIKIANPLRVGDPRRTRQVIYNLLSNAFKFTANDGTVRLEAHEDAAAVEFVVIRITDTGIGMTEECMKQIFHGFSQGDTSLRREYGGSGLGLAISKRLAEAMGGKIECQSRVGQGSTFVLTLRLPLASLKTHFGATPALGGTLRRSRDSSVALSQQHEAVGRSGAQTRQDFERESAAEQQRAESSEAVTSASAPTANKEEEEKEKSEKEEREKTKTKTNGSMESPLAKEASALAGKRVLLVEDNQVNQKVGVRMLNSLGCKAIVAVNGLEAVNAMERHYDVRSREHADGPDREIDAAGKGGERAAGEKNESDKTAKDGEAKDESRDDHIDLILMDCQMPVMDGFKATARIRKLERQIGEQSAASARSEEGEATQPHIPILALTASATAEYQQKCFRQGMDDFLSKPLNRSTLAKMLGKWLLAEEEEEEEQTKELF